MLCRLANGHVTLPRNSITVHYDLKGTNDTNILDRLGENFELLKHNVLQTCERDIDTA